eukprot:365028-Chlamydomonas_euryale.AAC.18
MQSGPTGPGHCPPGVGCYMHVCMCMPYGPCSAWGLTRLATMALDQSWPTGNGVWAWPTRRYIGQPGVALANAAVVGWVGSRGVGHEVDRCPGHVQATSRPHA